MGRRFFFICFIGIFLNASHAEEGREEEQGDRMDNRLENRPENRKPPSLQNLLSLTDELPKAVCDENQVDRPPAVGFLFADEKKEKSLPYSVESYFLKSKIPSSDTIRLLMEDDSFLFAPKSVIGRWNREKETKNQSDFKRSISFEICVASVTKSQLNELYRKDQGLFFKLRPATNAIQPEKLKPQEAILEIRDIEDRAGLSGSEYIIPGWIQSSEVRKVQLGSLVIEKLLNPVTNKTLLTIARDPDYSPLGFFYLTKSPSKTKGREALKNAQFRIYELMLEGDSYRALENAAGDKSKVVNIQKLHGFYKNLIEAYKLYPTSPQFKNLSAGQLSLSHEQAKKSLEMMLVENKNLIISNSRVEFQSLDQDPRLHRMYEDFRKEIGKILK